MNGKLLKNIFRQGGTIETWRPVLDFVFDKVEYFATPSYLFSENKKVISGKHAGRIKLDDGRSIGLFEVQVDNSIQIERNRQGLREIAAKYIDQNISHGALVFYHSPLQEAYRLTFIAHWSKIDLETGELKKGETEKKRYTYVLGGRHSGTTTAQRLLELRNKSTNSKSSGKGTSLEDIKQAFSVSTLTKEFYNELFQWYQWVLSETVNVTFPRDPRTIEDDREKLEEQIIRLITRLLFVWFIKQKNLVPDALFNTLTLKKVLKDFDPASATDGTYYNAILQNLFFATLNKAVNERDFSRLKNNRDIKTLYRYAEMFSISEKEIIQLFRPIPFLNGGLFECLDKEDIEGNKYFLDGFSRNDTRHKGRLKHRAFIPNCVFFDEEKGIIPLLERYNFTVEENAPEDVQVALDPELLGNVFENLLGAFNNETKETARKQSGSFYTPRDIVAYMVSESLVAYLENACSTLNPNTLRTLFEGDHLPHELEGNEFLCKEISDKLKSVKIIDPACGSGAFPMGILKKMVEVLEKLDVNNTKTIYDQKLHLIEECVYGVDIQTIAAQISKLRFFISLICEQGPMDLSTPENNYGVITLPNLETKFVAANALIGLKKKKAGDFVGLLFENPRINEVKKEILEIRHEHFYSKTATGKKRLREKDENLRAELATLLEENGDFAPEDAKQLAQWNPYDQNLSSAFFDAEWMFGLKEGFDIVIGNPPYVQLQKNGGALARQFENMEYKTFARTGDLYSLFYEKGVELLKPRGHLTFITSNKWMRAGYGESTRKFFIENTNPILLIDFAGQKIFDAATVDTNILMLSKEKNRQKTQACIVRDNVLNNLSVFVRQSGATCNFSSSESWVILSSIEQSIKTKIEAMGTPLKDWDISIYRGILTGYNDAFIIDGNKKDELIARDPKSAEIIRPILRGRDIKRYGYSFEEQYLIATFPAKKYKIDAFPAVKNHLLTFGRNLLIENGYAWVADSYLEEWCFKRLEQTGKEIHINGVKISFRKNEKSRKATANQWFETQDSISYWEDFNRQKIVWGNLNLNASYSIAPDGVYVNAPCPMIVPANEYLLAALNSKVADYYIRSLGVTRNGGYFEYKPMFIEKLPVPIISETQQKKINALVKQRNNSDLDSSGINEIEKSINDWMYELYDLNQDEIDFIEL